MLRVRGRRAEVGVAIRGKVWKEILVTLEKVKPDVRSTISFQIALENGLHRGWTQ
jgi:hypothetical protein